MMMMMMLAHRYDYMHIHRPSCLCILHRTIEATRITAKKGNNQAKLRSENNKPSCDKLPSIWLKYVLGIIWYETVITTQRHF